MSNTRSREEAGDGRWRDGVSLKRVMRWVREVAQQPCSELIDKAKRARGVGLWIGVQTRMLN